MGDVDIKLFDKSEDKKLYRLTSNDNEIYIKIKDISLPFNCQVYNKNLYLNAELFKSEKSYNENIKIINSFEKCIINKLNLDKNFVSIIKDRNDAIHLKCMFKRTKNGLVLTTKSKDDTYIDIDIFKLKEAHKLNQKYDIIIKPEVLWETEDSYGITYYLVIIINN